MTDAVTAKLDIRAGPASPGDGYTNTPTSNGKTYCYQWTGGSDGHGNITEDLRTGVGAINIEVIADQRFHIVEVGFGEGNTQFAYHPINNTHGTISDAGTAVELDYFNVQLINTINEENCTFWCDPNVRNRN
ncbi:MAG: hypothetical protein AAF385_15070 [Pseudomonadota bacterium]